jgi:hypothetical protein
VYNEGKPKKKQKTGGRKTRRKKEISNSALKAIDGQKKASLGVQGVSLSFILRSTTRSRHRFSFLAGKDGNSTRTEQTRTNSSQVKKTLFPKTQKQIMKNQFLSVHQSIFKAQRKIPTYPAKANKGDDRTKRWLFWRRKLITSERRRKSPCVLLSPYY